MKLRDASFLVLALAAGPAHAQGGINLSWDDCGTHGQEVRFFACDTNVGTSTLYVSAVAPEPIPQLNAVEIVIDLVTSQATLSDWWSPQTGGCRAGSLTGQFDFTGGPFNCLDVWAGTAFGGMNYAAGFTAPNRARLRGVAAIPGSIAVDDQAEMYLFAFRFNHDKSVGAGSCAGCEDKACFVLNQVNLYQPAGVGDHYITHSLDRQWAFWRCPGAYHTHGANCSFTCSTPAARPTWGSIKSMYR